MPLNINSNLNSMGAQRNVGRSQHELSTALARLSSGLRLNSARDDAAGLAISERFTSQVRGTSQAGRNANDAISLAQTAESALGSIGDGLQRIRELAVQSANATNSSSDRAALQQEVAHLVQEIERVATQTQFNGINLIDGSFNGKTFQVGANTGESISVAKIGSARTSAMGEYQGFSAVNQWIGIPTVMTPPLSVNVGGTVVSLGNVLVDAKDLAAAINKGNVSGLSASANPTQIAAGTSTANATASGTAMLRINGINIAIAGVNGAAALAGNRAAAVAAINAQTAATGVIATETGAGVTLTAPDGRNINPAYSPGTFTSSNTSDFGFQAFMGLTASTLNLSYVAPPGVTGTVTFSQPMSGFNTTATIAPTGTAVSAVDISTAHGAQAALASIDAALDTLNASRASLGAVQNRFGSTITHLAVTTGNLSAARSRIQDADFAMETANLSRAQVLQQVGTAMVAQANQLPRQVLALLR